MTITSQELTRPSRCACGLYIRVALDLPEEQLVVVRLRPRHADPVPQQGRTDRRWLRNLDDIVPAA